MLLLNCALKLVEEIILYYDARSKKHQNTLRILIAFPLQQWFHERALMLRYTYTPCFV